MIELPTRPAVVMEIPVFDWKKLTVQMLGRWQK